MHFFKWINICWPIGNANTDMHLKFRWWTLWTHHIRIFWPFYNAQTSWTEAVVHFSVAMMTTRWPLHDLIRTYWLHSHGTLAANLITLYLIILATCWQCSCQFNLMQIEICMVWFFRFTRTSQPIMFNCAFFYTQTDCLLFQQVFRFYLFCWNCQQIKIHFSVLFQHIFLCYLYFLSLFGFSLICEGKWSQLKCVQT